MFKIKVSDQIKEHCIKQIQKYNFGKRGVADGSKREQLTGIIGESVVADICGKPLVDGSSGFDGGEDIKIGDYSVDVKTMGRTTAVRYGYINNFLALQQSYATDVYIFTSLNKKTDYLTICGWLPKNELLEKAILYKKGTTRKRFDGTEIVLDTDNYEIDNKFLRPVFNKDHMITNIYLGWIPPKA